MKKIIPFIFLVSFPLLLNAQWFGNGLSAGTAYYGVINGSNTMQAWNLSNYPGGVIYIGRSATGQNDLEVASGGTLIIQAGITVKFCTTASDLRITGTGILNATGSSSSTILFTKDTQASWGHISFEASTGTSVINFCTIEYGLKTGAGIEGYGGGILANTNTLTISNCTIRNNYAQYGGGVFVYSGRNPVINNCYVYNNRAMHAGGGFYFWNTASSVITNCIFDSNQSLDPSVSYYTGGGLAAQTTCSIKVVNCTFVNNTSTRPEGQAILLHGSPNSRVINSIFWGVSTKQVYCYSTSGNTLINCAYRGITYTTGTAPINSIILNSVNNASDGPNFVATDGSNWSIDVLSPCRNAGVNSYPGVTIPPLDYSGNSRIGITDIGAFEARYCIWTGATNTLWSVATNWEGSIDPSTVGSADILIPSGLTNYPTGSSPDFTIQTGRIMLIQPGAHVNLGNLINNGSLTLQSDATALSSLLISSYSGNDAVIGLFLSGGLAGGSGTQKWHYISSPVSSLPVSTFAPTYTMNVVGWYDARVTTTLAQGWVAYDGYVYSSGGMGGPTFSSLTPGKGYDYYDSGDDQYTFSGQFNTSDVPFSLSYAVVDSLHGFNLLGNPFSAGLNWDAIVNGGSYPAKTNKYISYTRDNTECTYINGVGNPGDVTGIIPPMQGFFVRTHSAGNTITLAASARTQSGNHLTYKALEVIPLVRLAFAEGSATDETVVRFDNNASKVLDNDFDGIKMFISTTNTQLYTALGGTNYAINGQPFPTDSIDIPVVVNLIAGGDHNISAIQIQGMDNYNLFLIDKTASTRTNLKSNPTVTFTALAGKFTDRFVLRITRPMVTSGSGGDPIPPVVPPVTDTTPVIGSDPGSGHDTVPVLTAIKDRTFLNGTFNIYPSFGSINIQDLSDDWDGLTGSVRVIDLMGKPVSDLQNAEFRRGDIIQVPAPVARGMYFVEIKSGMKRFVGKIMIR